MTEYCEKCMAALDLYGFCACKPNKKDCCPSCGVPYIEHLGLIGTCKSLQTFLKDSCEDDDEIRKLCREVLTEKEVFGDSYGVPSNVDLVELLVNKIKNNE